MGKSVKYFGILIVILGVTALFLTKWSDSSEEIAVASNKDVVNVETAINEDTSESVLKDFVFDLGTRYNSIKRKDLIAAKSFADFIGDAHLSRIVSYSSLSVTVLEDSEQTGIRRTDIKETGISGDFTLAQLKLLHSLDYSTNILIRADYMEKRDGTGKIEKDAWTPYLTIVPEKQAVYVDGKVKLINYLIEKSSVKTIVIEKDKVESARLFFTVTKNGTIEKVKLEGTSGYPSIDEAMIELIGNTPGKWEPAENTKGEKVAQELMISFGRMGC